MSKNDTDLDRWVSAVFGTRQKTVKARRATPAELKDEGELIGDWTREEFKAWLKEEFVPRLQANIAAELERLTAEANASAPKAPAVKTKARAATTADELEKLARELKDSASRPAVKTKGKPGVKYITFKG